MAAIGILASCTEQASTGDPSLVTQGTPMRWANVAGSADWFSHVAAAIDADGSNLMTTRPGDIASWCPDYSGQTDAERRAFWAFLMSALMKFESNYRTETSFVESFNDSQGNPVVSRGLLQLSIESANGYTCGIGDAQELHDPKVNLQCAVKIMDRWVGRDGVISARSDGNWRGLARYWSPFRSEARREEMQRLTSASSYCT